MACICKEQSQVLRIQGTGLKPWPNLKQMETANWITLFGCTQCEQLWAIDVPDKYQIRLAFKISAVDGNIEAWDGDHITLRKEFLLQFRGGLGTLPCEWFGCKNIQVLDSAYCVDHLYAIGARA